MTNILHQITYWSRPTCNTIVAWKALVEAVHLNGKLGYVQVPAATPGSVTFEDTQAYGVGAFLLAGEEMVKLLETHENEIPTE